MVNTSLLTNDETINKINQENDKELKELEEINDKLIENLLNKLNTLKYEPVKKNKINNYFSYHYNNDYNNLIISGTSTGSCREMARCTNTGSNQGMRTVSFEFNPF